MTNTPLNPDALEAGKSSAKDELWGRLHGGYISDEEVERAAESAVSAYLSVAQPEVNSVEELDNLPMHSYVQGNDGFKHAKDWAGGWHLIVNRPSDTPHLSGSIELPARVLYLPPN